MLLTIPGAIHSAGSFYDPTLMTQVFQAWSIFSLFINPLSAGSAMMVAVFTLLGLFLPN